MRARVIASTLACAAALALGPTLGAARAQEQSPPPVEDQIVLSGSVTVPRGDAVGEVLVFTGRVTVHGVVEGDVVVFEGPVVVTGQVDGALIAADGTVRLRSSARVGDDVAASDRVVAQDGARVGGEVREGVRFSLEGALASAGDLLGPLAVAVSVLLTGLALLWLAPRGADASAEALAAAPLASLGWGLLVALAVPVVAVALCVLVLGLPLGLALLLSSGLWWIVGLALAAWSAGRSLLRPPRARAVAFLAGWAVLAAVGLVPTLNAAVWTLAAVLGLGAAVVAAGRARRGGGPSGRHRRAPRREEASVEAGFA